jgi:hypothetical protein
MGRLRFFLLLAAVVTALLSSAAYLFLQVYGEDLKQAVIRALNQRLNTEVRTQQITLSVWEQFPDVAVAFTDVRVASSLPDTPRYVARFHKVRAVVSPLSAVWGPYEVRQFRVSDGYVKPRIKDDFAVNYQVLKAPPDSSEATDGQTPALNLGRITLRNIDVDYRNQAQEEAYALLVKELTLSGQLRQDRYTLQAEGQAQVQHVRIAGQSYAQHKPVTLSTQLKVNRPKGRYQFRKGGLTIAGADFAVSGSATQQGSGTQLDLHLEGRDNNLQTLLALVPEAYRQRFASYHGKGHFYCRADLTGQVTPRQNPKLQIDFGVEDGRISREQTDQVLTQVNLEGSFTNGNKQAAISTQLALDNFRASLRDRQLYGSLSLTNFTDPYLNLQVRGRPRLQDLQALLPFRDLPAMTGDFFVDADFAGRLRHLRQVSTMPKVNFKGRLGLEQAALQTPAQHPDFDSLDGHFSFNGNDLMIHRFKGQAGQSHFSLNGRFRNLASFMLLPGKPLIVDADLHSRELHLAPLVTTTTGQQGQASDTAATFALPDYLTLDLDFVCEELNYNRFQARAVNGALLYQGQKLRLPDLAFQAMDGQVNLSGNLTSQPNGNLKARLKGEGQGIRIRELFYQLKDFGQTVITHDHLAGTLASTVNMEATWNPRLEPLLDKLKVTSDVVVEEGQLNQFDPMLKLAGLVNVEELRQVSFQRLKNRIVIEDRQIRIPEMDVQSNAFNVRFSGTHQFNNTVDYRLKIDLSELLFGRKAAYETAYGKVVPSKDGEQLNLFVKMSGKAADPDIQYDRKAVARKLGKDLQQEGEELQKALKNPGRSEDEKDDYELEWDD